MTYAKRTNQSRLYYKTKENRPGKVLFDVARKRARVNDAEFTITVDDVVVPEFCPLLGIRLAPGELVAGPCSPSLDRIDSSKGYVPGNVWVLSHKANRMKNNATVAELVTFAEAVLRLHGPKV